MLFSYRALDELMMTIESEIDMNTQQGVFLWCAQARTRERTLHYPCDDQYFAFALPHSLFMGQSCNGWKWVEK